MNKKEFGDWAVVFWKKGSKILHIAQNQGEPGTTNYWVVGTTTRQFDYESGWLPNKEWTSIVKGHFSKDKAIQMAKENILNESEFFRKGQAFEGKRGKLYISKQLSPDEYLVRYSDFLLPSLSFTDWTFSEDELEEAIRKVQSGEQLVWDHFQSSKLKESKRDDTYKAIWDKCVHEIEKKKPDEGRFYDRFDFTTPRVDESKRTTNKKRIQESRGKALFQGGFPANLIYVGDPCYCLNDVIYQDAIKQADPEGKFDSIASGSHVEGAFVNTYDGDGEYEGSDGRNYSVDAGIIGIVNITNATATEGEDFQSFSKLGRVIKLPKYAVTQYEISRDDAGVITVDIKQGRFTETIAIPTGYEEEYTCNECGEPISEWEYRRYSGCCESCYRDSIE